MNEEVKKIIDAREVRKGQLNAIIGKAAQEKGYQGFIEALKEEDIYAKIERKPNGQTIRYFIYDEQCIDYATLARDLEPSVRHQFYSVVGDELQRDEEQYQQYMQRMGKLNQIQQEKKEPQQTQEQRFEKIARIDSSGRSQKTAEQQVKEQERLQKEKKDKEERDADAERAYLQQEYKKEVEQHEKKQKSREESDRIALQVLDDRRKRRLSSRQESSKSRSR